jgi:hypothetical protein
MSNSHSNALHSGAHRAVKHNEANWPARKSLRLVKDAAAAVNWREQRDEQPRRNSED